MSSLLGKIYSGLLLVGCYCSIWRRCNYTYECLSLICWMLRGSVRSKILHSIYTITAANTKVTRVGQGAGACNASDKHLAQYRVWSHEAILYAQLYCKQIMNTVSLNSKHLVFYQSPDTYVHV